MAYGYYQPNYYQTNGYQPTQYPQAQQQPQQGIIWVQGEEGAKAYMVAAGNSVLLMDSEASAFYIKSTDQSGMPMPLRVFEYAERQQTAKPTKGEEYVTRKEFEDFIATFRKGNDDGKSDL